MVRSLVRPFQREREADCEFDSAKEIEATISFIPYGKEEKKVDLYPIRGYNSSAFNGARLHRVITSFKPRRRIQSTSHFLTWPSKIVSAALSIHIRYRKRDETRRK